MKEPLITTRYDEEGEYIEGPIPPAIQLHAYLARRAGYYTNFTMHGDELIDANCCNVPPMGELVMRNPAIIGDALTWLAARTEKP